MGCPWERPPEQLLIERVLAQDWGTPTSYRLLHSTYRNR